MPDQISKSMTTVAWILISIIGIVVAAGATYGIAMFLVTPGIAVWIKLLTAAGIVGFVLLMIVVIRDRLKERKTDKYKDIEV